jgi:hypothetical protein
VNRRPLQHVSAPGRTGPIDCDDEEARLASQSLAAGDPTGWFEQLYAAGESGHTTMPFDRAGPHPLLVDWADNCQLAGHERRAIVVGCGLGADAEYIAGRLQHRRLRHLRDSDPSRAATTSGVNRRLPGCGPAQPPTALARRIQFGHRDHHRPSPSRPAPASSDHQHKPTRQPRRNPARHRRRPRRQPRHIRAASLAPRRRRDQGIRDRPLHPQDRRDHSAAGHPKREVLARRTLPCKIGEIRLWRNRDGAIHYNCAGPKKECR